MTGERVELVARQTQADDMKPYERLLGDALHGDSMLFVRQDGVEAAWNVVDPALKDTTPVHEYEPNTWGALDADRLIQGDSGWHNPTPGAEKAMQGTK